MSYGGTAYGGLVGTNVRHLSNALTVSSVCGTVGRVVGWNKLNATMENVLATGEVTGTTSPVGGLGGLIQSGIAGIRHAFWDQQATGKAMGYQYYTTTGTQAESTAETKSTIEMQTANSAFYTP